MFMWRTLTWIGDTLSLTISAAMCYYTGAHSSRIRIRDSQGLARYVLRRRGA